MQSQAVWWQQQPIRSELSSDTSPASPISEYNPPKHYWQASSIILYEWCYSKIPGMSITIWPKQKWHFIPESLLIRNVSVGSVSADKPPWPPQKFILIKVGMGPTSLQDNQNILVNQRAAITSYGAINTMLLIVRLHVPLVPLCPTEGV